MDEDTLTDAELAEYLGIEEAWVKLLPPSMRATYAHLAWVESELNAGRRPVGVMVCGE